MSPASPDLVFRVLGTPKPQPRPRAFFNRKTGTARVYDAGTAEGWKGCVALAAREAVHGCAFPTPWEGCPIAIEVTLYLPRAQGHFGTGRNAGKLRDSAPRFPMAQRDGDVDNTYKAIADCLTQIRVWHDDGQVVSALVTKAYATADEPPGARVMLWRLGFTAIEDA